MKADFVIITDTASELTDEYYREHGVEKVSIGYILNDVTYGGLDGGSMDIDEFYERIESGAMPKTFQVTPEQARVHFEPHLKAGKDVLVLSFSSGLSGTYNSYCLAANVLKEKYPTRKIIVIDTLSASIGQGLLVHYVVKKAESGATIEETAEYTKSIIPHVCHRFTVDNLFHLKQGGRVSGATAVVGSMLKIKPVLNVDEEGKLTTIAKIIGRKKATSYLVEELKRLSDLKEDDTLIIGHAHCREEAEHLRELVVSAVGEHEIFILDIGPVIGTHVGAGMLALTFLGATR